MKVHSARMMLLKKAKKLTCVVLAVFAMFGPTPCKTENRCEPLAVPVCQDLGTYGDTVVLPNLMGHTSQDEAALAINQFSPLLEVECSYYLRGVLCLLYAPPCGMSRHPYPPCSSLCQMVKDDCAPLVNEIGFQWPPSMDCEQFPARYSDGAPCFEVRTNSFSSPYPDGGYDGGPGWGTTPPYQPPYYFDFSSPPPDGGYGGYPGWGTRPPYQPPYRFDFSSPYPDGGYGGGPWGWETTPPYQRPRDITRQNCNCQCDCTINPWPR